MRNSWIKNKSTPCNVRDCIIDFVLTLTEKGAHPDTGVQVPRQQGKA